MQLIAAVDFKQWQLYSKMAESEKIDFAEPTCSVGTHTHTSNPPP